MAQAQYIISVVIKIMWARFGNVEKINAVSILGESYYR